MADLVLDDALVKRGETVIQFSFHRCPIGLGVTMKVHPRIEDLFQDWGKGEKVDAGMYGRQWRSFTGEPLLLWDLQREDVTIDPTGQFVINKPGTPLVDDLVDPYGTLLKPQTVANLSILRLVGASSAQGVTFGVDGVYTTKEIRRIAEAIKQASKAFYLSYLKPINLNVMVSTQELK